VAVSNKIAAQGGAGGLGRFGKYREAVIADIADSIAHNQTCRAPTARSGLGSVEQPEHRLRPIADVTVFAPTGTPGLTTAVNRSGLDYFLRADGRGSIDQPGAPDTQVLAGDHVHSLRYSFAIRPAPTSLLLL